MLRKVCSTLAAFFLHPNSSWQLPIRHLLTFYGAQVSEHEETDDVQKTWDNIQHVSPSQLRSVLWLGSSLVEEVTKLDVKGLERSVSRTLIRIWLILKSAKVAERVVKNAYDVWYLIWLTLRCLHLRNGHLESQPSFLPNYLSSSSEAEVLELSKEALDTASVLSFSNQSWCVPLTPCSRVGYTFTHRLIATMTRLPMSSMRLSH